MIWIYVIGAAAFLCLLSFVAGILVGLTFWEEIADGLITVMHYIGLGE